MSQLQFPSTEILVAFYTKVLAYLRPTLTGPDLPTMAADAAKAATNYAKTHPYQGIFVAINVGLMPVLGSGWLTTQLLKIIGFGPLGPIAGKCF